MELVIAVQEKRGQSGNGRASQQPRFSLLDGSYHASIEQDGRGAAGGGPPGGAEADASSTALACRAEQALQLTGTCTQCTIPPLPSPHPNTLPQHAPRPPPNPPQ